MHRIDTPSAQKDKFGVGKNGFTRGNPQTGTAATKLDNDYFDSIQEEICGVIEGAGIALDKTKRTQLAESINKLIGNSKAPAASTTVAGIVQLNSAINSTAENQAATPKAVKTAYDLANDALPKEGGTLTGDLTVNKSRPFFNLRNTSGKGLSLVTENSGYIAFNYYDGSTYSPKYVYNPNTNALNFLNLSNVTINDLSVLKAGDGGLYAKSPLLTAGTDFSSDLVTNNNQIFTLSGRYVGTPDDTASWGGVLEVKRGLYDASTACILTIKFNNRTYEKEGNKSSGNWVWGSWKEIITTANVGSYVGKSYVTETYQSSDGTSWYRKWSDGFIEQGGVTDNLTINETVVNLLTPMSTANYIVNLQVITESTVNEFFNPVFNRTTSSFSTRLRGYNGSQISNAKSTWLVTGY